MFELPVDRCLVVAPKLVVQKRQVFHSRVVLVHLFITWIFFEHVHIAKHS